MGVSGFTHFSFGSHVGSTGAAQAVFAFLLIPCCQTLNFRAPPLIPDVTFLWAWNVPSDLCSTKFAVPLDISLFSLVGNPQRGITGQNLTIFYVDRLGYYPYIDEKTGRSVNGGIPQAASLEKHLTKAREDISYYIPTDQTGLAVIDWENWRPIWERNWKPKDIYKKVSIEFVQQQNIQLNVIEATKIAKVNFQNAAKSFMQETLKLGKLLRPSHVWGYYLFPDCYNHRYTMPGYNGSCPDIEKRRNDELNWLWLQSTALFPSIYLKSYLKSSDLAALFVRNRVQESIRLSQVRNAESPLPVFVYTRSVFTDAPLDYLSQGDLVHTLGESIALGVSGAVVWGNTKLTSSWQSCMSLANYLKTTLNPYIINVTLAAKMCSQVLCQEQGVCTRKQWNSTDYLHLNPENFVIHIGKGGQYIVHGKPTPEDLQQFSQNFQCSCYAGFGCKERDDLASIHAINVCTAEGVCIDTFLSEEPKVGSSSHKVENSLTFSNISNSTPFVTESPFVPETDLSGSLKTNCSEKGTSTNAREDCQGADRKNMSSLQNEKKETTNSSISSMFVKFLVHILYVLISLKFLYLVA
ncbi:hyaluronidase PH-20 [Orycteropus afer afer]|uniref:Hyaluronidase n=1 Tax=Orycteropus afer afer TaxID=1230840 RepID=A0A8B7ABX1_ORYAF|nr:hyaluronidase PH-20 [Orycteropus afer afer]